MNIQTPVKADKAERMRRAREEAYATPLKNFHPGAPRLFQDDTLWPWFERLRKEEPVHYCTNAPIEPYWSVAKNNEITHVDTNHGRSPRTRRSAPATVPLRIVNVSTGAAVQAFPGIGEYREQQGRPAPGEHDVRRRDDIA